MLQGLASCFYHWHAVCDNALDYRSPDNIASTRTCELVGAKFVEIVNQPADTDMYQQGERQKCRYRLNLQDI